MYVRLAPRGAQPPAAPPVLDEKARKEKEKQDKKNNKKKGKEAQDLAGQAVSGVEYPWEDYYDLTAVPPEDTQFRTPDPTQVGPKATRPN